MHVELRQVSKRYGTVTALDNFSLTLEPGQIVAVIGLNGAGKTTLLRCVAGLVGLTRGQVLLDGKIFSRDQLDRRRRFHFLPDFPAVPFDQNVLAHASLLVRVYQRDPGAAEEPLLRALTELDLLNCAETPFGQLSRGQAYKAAFSILRALNPELWLLDEPFASGLDPQGIAVLKQCFRAHAAGGGTVIYSTQILEIAEKCCDRLIVIAHGRLAANYTRAEIAAFAAEGDQSLEARLGQFRDLP